MGIGLDARESTAALREGTLARLQTGFGLLVQAESNARGWDDRDTMISLAPFIDCARRLGHDPLLALSPIAGTGPEWFREVFEAFVRRADVTLAAFGWSIIETPDGPAYQFVWPA